MSENDTCFIAKEQRAATESQVLSYGNNKKVSALKRLSLCVFRSLLGAWFLTLSSLRSLYLVTVILQRSIGSESHFIQLENNKIISYYFLLLQKDVLRI